MKSSSSAKRTISVELLRDLLLGQPEHDPVDKDVFPSGDLRMEPRPQLDQGRDLALDRQPSGRGLGDSGDHFQDRALARAVFSDQAERLAFLDDKADVVDGRDDFVGPQRLKQVALDDGAFKRLETMPGRIFLIMPGDVIELDGGHQTSSGNESRRRSKTAYPIQNRIKPTNQGDPQPLPVEQPAEEEAVLVAVDDVGHRIEAEDPSEARMIFEHRCSKRIDDRRGEKPEGQQVAENILDVPEMDGRGSKSGGRSPG